MKRIIEKVIPNLSIALSLALLTVMVFNIFNPMMGFFYGNPINVLVSATCIVAIINGISSYASWRKKRISERKREDMTPDE